MKGSRALCWIVLDDDGTLRKLGYQLDEKDDESVYEFQDWRRDGPLPYPALTLQINRQATFAIQYIEPDATLDPALWTRKAR